MILLVGKKNNEEFWEIQKDPLKALCALSKTYDYKVFEMNGKWYCRESPGILKKAYRLRLENLHHEE